MSKKNISIAIISLPLLFVLYHAISFFVFINSAPSDSPQELELTITKGSSLNQICNQLKQLELITNIRYFKLLAVLKGKQNQVKAGYFKLNTGMAPPLLLEHLLNPIALEVSFTIPEGHSIKQIAELLQNNKIIPDKNEFIQLAYEKRYWQNFSIKGKTLEGYLFPDTYRIHEKATSKEIIDMMLSSFFHKIQAFKKDIEKSPHSLEKIITIASIIEKETSVPDERKMISSVIFNRLKRNMRLQMDPTVIYGIKNFNGNLTKKDLQTFNPYNTYRIKGIPPGPIANPGIDSIEAALFPSKTKLLYFVAKNDGTHIFSKSFSQHQKYVRKYQQDRNFRLKMQKKHKSKLLKKKQNLSSNNNR